MTNNNPRNPASGTTYQGANTEILSKAMAANGWVNPRFVTFLDATANHCHPRRGCHGTKIMKVGAHESDQDATGKPKKYIKFYTVFNIEQLSGDIPAHWLGGSSEIFQALAESDMHTLSEEELQALLDMAIDEDDTAVITMIEAHLDSRDRYQKSMERRAQLEWAGDMIDRQWEAADIACKGLLVNKLGYADGIKSRDLFRMTMKRARKYATEELLRYWVDNPRMTKTALRGTREMREKAAKECFMAL
ncbi:MAG: ArdC-like ssDNA-binding domain-containing protein [Propionibacteriaceae bacterium]|nr:ArdC-like ssDNA-binding domain-containing protein [Propionibacteriaceae bacterium]